MIVVCAVASISTKAIACQRAVLGDHPTASHNLHIGMTNSDTPKDGDFAAFLERQAAAPALPKEPTEVAPRQTLDDVLVGGQEPTSEFLEAIDALRRAEPLSDEELARQALEHPGADGDPSTPE
ncbi:hypothetical protein [Roseateles sp. LYH14W]|uniref:Uncharacterized protein n=1 Tax=Pelomonas parva TaxID=3299032 RepID=A0ABW7FA98_9BURK